MAYTVDLLPSDSKELQKLQKGDRTRVFRRIEGLADNPRPRGVEPLHERLKGLYRLKVGVYRVLYRVQDVHLVVLVVKVKHRREVYRL